MRPVALPVIIVLTVCSLPAFGQAEFRLVRPNQVKKGEKFFSLAAQTRPAAGDSLTRIAHIYKENQKIISYKLFIVADSLRFTTTRTDSVVADSAGYHLLIAPDSISRDQEYKVTLVNSSDLAAEFPIEDIYNHTSLRVKSLSMMAASVKVDGDTSVPAVPKKFPVSIHGSITSIGQASDGKYLYQTTPQNFVRTFVNTEIELFGLPFSAGYTYTTESNPGPNRINNFRVSFRYDRFFQGIRSKMDKKLETDKADKIKRVTRLDIGSLDQELSKLQHELNSREFKRSFQKNREVLDLGDRDTSFRKTFRYKKAFQKQQDFTARLDRIKEIEKLKLDYSKYSQVADYDTRIRELNLSKPGDFRKGARRFGLIRPGQSIFLSLKKFDLGTFDPDYSVLVLSGVSLTGINVELNPGNLYGAFTWGKAVANFNNPLDLKALAGGRNIMSGRIGLGNKDKLLVAMSVLKGTDDDRNRVMDTSYNYYLPSYNYVVGVDAKYRISSNAEAGVEYAKSHNRQISQETRSAEEQIGRLINPNEGKFSSAWYAYTRVNLLNNRTRLKASTRYIDPFYYSFGTPYLRRDNFRVEFKGDQLFWKNQFTLGATYRRDKDNLYDLKQGTSVNNTLIFTTQLRIKKYPYLVLTYSPNFQSFYNSALRAQINSRIMLYNAITGYTYQNKQLMANTMLSYSRQYNVTNQAEWQTFDVSQYGLNEQVTLRKISLTMNAGINYALPKHQGDTGKLLSATVQATKGLFRNKISVTGGYRYQHDFTLEERNIIEAGTTISFGWGITCQVLAEKHFIRPYTIVTTATDMMLGRITITKTF
jgi:hypothetical protein